ncbi:MAG: hypothetical protein KUG79_08695 [Pseudomonadales bacterium]|nr:hypothetical protein [Pseudomonadales bacterium]
MNRLIITLIIALSALSSNAAILVSTDTADFNLTAEVFNTTPLGTNANLVSTSGALSLDNASGIGTVGDITGTHGYQDFNSTMVGTEYVLNGDENFDLLFSGTQTAFAMDYLDDNIVSIFNLEFFLDSTAVGATSFTTSAAQFDTVQFIGFSSTAGFNKVQIREDDGTGNANEFFQFYTATAVPGPSSLILFSSALLSLGFMRRRK